MSKYMKFSRCSLALRPSWIAALAAAFLPWAGAPLAAQSNYSTPYTFTFLAGNPSSAGSSDGTGSGALFDQPAGLAVDSSGNIFVADKDNDVIRMITSAGVVTTVAGTAGSSGTTDDTGAAARFNLPTGVAVASGGVIYVADSGNDVIRKIASGGVVTTLAGATSTPGYVDGTGTAAEFSSPNGVALDASGNLYVADTGNNAIRKVTSGGVVTLFAGTPPNAGSADGTGIGVTFYQPIGVAVDSSGNVYVTDSGNHTVRKITSGGTVSTIAGRAAAPGSSDGTGPQALFHSPRGIAVDSGGNLFVADSENSTVRKITPAGVVTTIGGSPGDFASAQGTGPTALFDIPVGIAIDGSGNLYVSNELGYTINKGAAATAAVPVFAQQPVAQTIAAGSTVVFRAVASGLPLPTYQWYRNGSPLANGGGVSGATGPTLVIAGATAAQAGTYYSAAANASAVVPSQPATLAVVSTPNAGRLVNISCRAQVGTGSDILITGFAVGGVGTSGTESLLIRASGPALVPFGVTGTLPDPSLELFTGSTMLSSNDGWAGNAAIETTAEAVGAFPWLSFSSLDSALLESLAPGAYTAQISGESGDTGIALAEVYDATPAGSYTPATPRLVNISARVNVGTQGNVLIVGFVIGGETAKTVLIRASGPALNAFGVTGTLPDPLLDLYSGTTVLASDFAWGGDSAIASAAASVGAFAWTDSASDDSAVLLTLAPGAYTAQVSGAAGDTGVALIEVYEVQ
jgi:sugar lactone lactonase YvrE